MKTLDAYVPRIKSWSKYPYFKIPKEAEVSLSEVALSICFRNQTFKVMILYQERIKKK